LIPGCRFLEEVSTDEAQTGQVWPRYGSQASNGRQSGQAWDAHELIPNVHGRAIAWWNITPARFPNQHLGGIYAIRSVFNTLIYSIIP